MINTSRHVEDVLAKIKIANSFTHAIPKLAWEVQTVYESGNPALKPYGWLINFTYQRPDTFTNKVGVGRGRQEFVPLGASESSIVKTAWLLLELLTRHELMESFMYDGIRIFNPHHTVADLTSAAFQWALENKKGKKMGKSKNPKVPYTDPDAASEPMLPGKPAKNPKVPRR